MEDLNETLRALIARYNFLLTSDFQIPNKAERLVRLREGIERVRIEIMERSIQWKQWGF